MEITTWQKELMEALAKKGLFRDDILSVMLVLTREEKGRAMLEFLHQRNEVTPDEIFEKAGKIAFGENA